MNYDNLKARKMVLENGEKITDIVNHENYIPFRQEDWARLLFIPFMIMGIYNFFKGDFLFILFAIPGLITFFNLLKRWMKIRQIKYYLTNKRLIIFNSSRNKIEHSFYYVNFPEMTLRENAYNYGFIIIGEPEKVTDVFNPPFPMRIGISLNDHKIVIDNIKNVRKLYNLIQEKVKAANRI